MKISTGQYFAVKINFYIRLKLGQHHHKIYLFTPTTTNTSSSTRVKPINLIDILIDDNKCWNKKKQNWAQTFIFMKTFLEKYIQYLQ